MNVYIALVSWDGIKGNEVWPVKANSQDEAIQIAEKFGCITPPDREGVVLSPDSVEILEGAMSESYFWNRTTLCGDPIEMPHSREGENIFIQKGRFEKMPVFIWYRIDSNLGSSTESREGEECFSWEERAIGVTDYDGNVLFGPF